MPNIVESLTIPLNLKLPPQNLFPMDVRAGQRFRINRRIGAGTFGEIYSGGTPGRISTALTT
jgi:hypothetical protein